MVRYRRRRMRTEKAGTLEPAVPGGIVLHLMRSPIHRGDRGLQGASGVNGEPEHSLALSLSTKRRDIVWGRSVSDKAWRQSVETRYGDGVRAAQRFYPLNCEPLSGRNNCPSKKRPCALKGHLKVEIPRPLGVLGVLAVQTPNIIRHTINRPSKPRGTAWLPA